MKNRKFWTGMLVVVLAFGMTVVGCDNGSDDGGGGGGGGAGGVGGTFTLTGIPSEYNGKYAVLTGGDENDTSYMLIGAKSVTMTSGTAVKISGGSVSLPMWKMTQSGSITGYTGNDTVEATFDIYNSAAINTIDDPVYTHSFTLIIFSKGNATKTWSQGLPGGLAEDAFAGTWHGSITADGVDIPLTVTAVHGTKTWTASTNGIDAYKGTYIADGYDVTITFTHVNTALPSGTTWTPYGSLSFDQRRTFHVPDEQDVSGTIDGDQWEMMEGIVFTKK